MATTVLWDLLHPTLQHLHLYSPPDPTFGRYLIPPWLPESTLLSDPLITSRARRVFIPPDAPYDSTEIEFAEDVELVEEELGRDRRRGGRWVFYRVFEMKEEGLVSKDGCGVDIILVHGLNEYGTRYSPHLPSFLSHGFRLILPDLPSYGRSTGIHSNLPNPHLLTAAVYVVGKDLVMCDEAEGREQREVFLTGASMGGWTVLYYIITYPPAPEGSTREILNSSSPSTPTVTASESGASPMTNIVDDEEAARELKKDEDPEREREYRPKVAGAFVLCPLVGVAPDSRPSAIVEGIARLLVKVAPSLPLAEGVKGNVSDDPRVEIEFRQDPLTYKGKLRASTGLALLEGFTELQKKAEMIKLPIRIIHGNHDRATSHIATQEFFERIGSEEKELEIYDGYEHVMTKVGIDEADDAKRQVVLKDWVGWMRKRAVIDKEKAKANGGVVATGQ